MLRFTVRRVIELVLVFFGVTFAIYAAVFALPGDPISSLGAISRCPRRWSSGSASSTT